MSDVDRLRSLARGTDPGFTSRELLVTDMGADPRDVVVDFDGEPTTMRCLSSYPVRNENDIVLALQLSGTWLVVGLIGSIVQTTLTEARVAEMIDARLAAPFDVSWGQGAPAGAGWLTTTSAYVRDNSNGSRSLYFDRGTPTPPPSPKPTPTPGPATVTPDDSAGWRGSYQEDSPKQGDASGYGGSSGNWIGGWFYGTKIADACAGKTVKNIYATLAREDSSHGRNAKVRVHLGTHNSASIAKPSIDNRYDTGLYLNRDGSGRTLLPGTVRDLLASGARRGIGCWANGSADYLDFTRNCGRLDIEFA